MGLRKGEDIKVKGSGSSLETNASGKLRATRTESISNRWQETLLRRHNMVKVINPDGLEEYSPARHYDIFNRQMVGRPMGAEKMSVALGRIVPGGWAEIHTHESSEHCHYMLKGEVVITMPNESITVRAGQAVWTAVQEPHGMRNESNEEALYLVISAPLVG